MRPQGPLPPRTSSDLRASFVGRRWGPACSTPSRSASTVKLPLRALTQSSSPSCRATSFCRGRAWRCVRAADPLCTVGCGTPPATLQGGGQVGAPARDAQGSAGSGGPPGCSPHPQQCVTCAWRLSCAPPWGTAPTAGPARLTVSGDTESARCHTGMARKKAPAGSLKAGPWQALAWLCSQSRSVPSQICSSVPSDVRRQAVTAEPAG